MKTAVITGSSQGIGAVLAQKFMDNGYKVILSARNENEFVRNLGENAKFIKADIRERKSHFLMVEKALEWTGRLDAYINNAGLSMWKAIENIDEEFLSQMIETNLIGTFWGCQAALKGMQNGGVILNISSLAGKRGSANNSAYCASKFGVNGLTQSLAKELGGKKIRVNAICPVYIKTDNMIDALKDNVSPTGGNDIEKYFNDFAKSQAALQRLPLAS